MRKLIAENDSNAKGKKIMCTLIKLKTLCLLLFISFLLSTMIYPQTAFIKAYGRPNYGKSAKADYAYSIAQTSDGGYIICGVTENSFYYESLLLLKLDSQGTIIWSKISDDQVNQLSRSCYSVAPTTDNGFIMLARWGDNVHAVKFDSSANVIWSMRFGKEIDFKRYGGITQTPDNGCILAGYIDSYSKALIIKLNSSGAIQWRRSIFIDSNAYDYMSIVPTSDGNYILATETDSLGAGGSDVIVIKIDANGTVQWGKTFGNQLDDYFKTAAPTSDGGVLIAGKLRYSLSWLDDFIIKLDSSGNLIWQKKAPLGKMTEISDGSYIIATDYGKSYNDNVDLFYVEDNIAIFNVNASGNILWSRSIYGHRSEEVRSIIPTSDGGFALAGNTYSYRAGGYSEVLMAKLNSQGLVPGCNLFFAGPPVMVSDISLAVRDPILSIAAPSLDYKAYPFPFSNTVLLTNSVCQQ